LTYEPTGVETRSTNGFGPEPTGQLAVLGLLPVPDVADVGGDGP
jgi:hypothetical protein